MAGGDSLRNVGVVIAQSQPPAETGRTAEFREAEQRQGLLAGRDADAMGRLDHGVLEPQVGAGYGRSSTVDDGSARLSGHEPVIGEVEQVLNANEQMPEVFECPRSLDGQ